MGCTQSKGSSSPPKKIVKKGSSKKIILHKSLSKSNETFKATVCEEEISSKIREHVDFTPPQSPKVKCHEDEIELIFKSKRANVYTAGATLDNRINYKPKNIIKSNAQNTLIRRALDQNFVFASLDSAEKKVLTSAMERVSVRDGDNLITQGQKGDYFYIIESGRFDVLVNNQVVSTLETGKSFGELALLYNTPRAATVHAIAHSVVYALDRDTFRNTLANTSFSKAVIITQALGKVPLLEGLTDAQRTKISDVVEMLPFCAGDELIKKGTDGNVFYMIKEGRVRVSDVGDGKTYSDHDLGPGEYFGERALITGEPRAANIRAITNVVLMALDRLSFDSLLGPLKEVLNQNMILRVLNSQKIFLSLDTNTKSRMVKSFVRQVFLSGAVIVKQGESNRKFFVLNDGNAQMLRADVVVGEKVTGSIFGEKALAADEMSPHTLIATMDTVCFTLTRDAYLRVISSSSSKETPNKTGQSPAMPPLAAQISRKSVTALASDTVDVPKVLQLTDLKHVAILGSGTFGRVSLVQDSIKDKYYALKTMLKSEIVLHRQQENVLNEKNVMMCCHHPFIIRLYATFKNERKLYMLLEFVQGGELFAIIHTNKKDGISDIQAQFYAAGMVLALGYLHRKEIAYRDLKPENCLIDRDGFPKLIDFGFAKIITGGGKTYTLCGTPEYLAPELVLGRGHNKAVDYWALGILIYEMIAGHSPFADAAGNDQAVICRNIVSGRLLFPRNFNPECKPLVEKLLLREIQNRLGTQRGGADDVVKHPWFAKIDFNAYLYRKIKAPWTPKIKNVTDCSHFDSQGIEEHPNDGAVDLGIWDRGF